MGTQRTVVAVLAAGFCFLTFASLSQPASRPGQQPQAKAQTGVADSSKEYWAFRPLTNPRVPQVRSTAAVKTPVDVFLLSALEKKGLAFAPPIDRRRLIRRVSLDLLGLPPTPAEVEAFVADPDPRAYEKLVDRLLASPHYGERWARHWLDLAR